MAPGADGFRAARLSRRTPPGRLPPSPPHADPAAGSTVRGFIAGGDRTALTDTVATQCGFGAVGHSPLEPTESPSFCSGGPGCGRGGSAYPRTATRSGRGETVTERAEDSFRADTTHGRRRCSPPTSAQVPLSCMPPHTRQVVLNDTVASTTVVGVSNREGEGDHERL